MTPKLFLFVAVGLVALAQMPAVHGEPAPEPRPFNLGKAIKGVINGPIKGVINGPGKCVANKGVPQSVATKAVACGPSAALGPELFAACAGIASISDAKNIVGCFGK